MAIAITQLNDELSQSSNRNDVVDLAQNAKWTNLYERVHIINATRAMRDCRGRYESDECIRDN